VQESLAPGEASRWGTAVGNIEDARVALDTLARAIEDAVYLDEDAYNQVAPVMQFQRTIQVLRWKSAEPCLPPALVRQCQENNILQVQQQRITELTVELQETNNKLHDSRALKSVADQRITEMTQELENNAGATL